MKNSSTERPDHHSDAAIASIWLILVALVAVIELLSLFVSRTMSMALH